MKRPSCKVLDFSSLGKLYPFSVLKHNGSIIFLGIYTFAVFFGLVLKPTKARTIALIAVTTFITAYNVTATGFLEDSPNIKCLLSVYQLWTTLRFVFWHWNGVPENNRQLQYCDDTILHPQNRRLQKLLWSYNLVSRARMIGFYGKLPQVPPPPKYNRKVSLVLNFCVGLLSIICMDCISSYFYTHPWKYDAGYYENSTGTLLITIYIMLMMHMVYHFAAFLDVHLWLAKVEETPTLFSNPWEMYSVKRFWGYVTPQLLRPLIAPMQRSAITALRVPYFSLSGRLARAAVGFACLTMFFGTVSFALNGTDGGFTGYFLLQFFLVMGEELYGASYWNFKADFVPANFLKRSTLEQAVGVVWTGHQVLYGNYLLFNCWVGLGLEGRMGWITLLLLWLREKGKHLFD